MLSIRTLVLIPVALATESVKSGECKGYNDCDADSKLFCYWDNSKCVPKKNCTPELRNDCMKTVYPNTLKNKDHPGFSDACQKCANEICEKKVDDLEKNWEDDKCTGQLEGAAWVCEVDKTSKYDKVCKSKEGYAKTIDCYETCEKEKNTGVEVQCKIADYESSETPKTETVTARCAEKNAGGGESRWVPNECHYRKNKEDECASDKKGARYQACSFSSYKCVTDLENSYNAPPKNTNVAALTETTTGTGAAAQICISGVFCLLLAMML